MKSNANPMLKEFKMKYLLSRDYKNSGPYEVFELVRMAKSGELQDGKGWYVCEEGKKNWVEVTKIPDIKSVFAVLAKPKSVPASGNAFSKGKKK